MADYSALDRLLHRMALGNRAVAEMAHDIERGRYLKSSPEARGGHHVFVTGLARAGTTILMREIHATGQFGSLTYADMPFVLAPNLWAGLSRKKAGARAERAHGDGIEVDMNSPEALEEVYWRVFHGAEYISATGLTPHNPTSAAMDGYLDYLRLILRRTGKTRYLAKNNNAILRLRPQARALPDSVFLVPMRAPLQQAQSLLHQHRRFLTADKFTAEYMTWLAHHEFGATQRPFRIGRGPSGDPMTLDYWLEQWITVHSELGRVVAGLNTAWVVPHEDLTGNPLIWSAVCGQLGVRDGPLTEIRSAAPRAVDPHDPALAAEADAIYRAMRSAALPRILAQTGTQARSPVRADPDAGIAVSGP